MVLGVLKKNCNKTCTMANGREITNYTKIQPALEERERAGGVALTCKHFVLSIKTLSQVVNSSVIRKT
jgi:hypothetical protein